MDTRLPALRVMIGRRASRRLALAALTLLAACTSSPLGRGQLILYPEADMARMGAAAFAEMQAQTPVLRQGSQSRHVECVAAQVIRALPGGDPAHWEVRVFDDAAVNAFALPGRKIGVYRGLLDVATTADQLAAVIGHEIAHVTARHANERVSTQSLASSGLQVVQIATGTGSPAQQELFGLLGLGAQVGLILPFGRAQETEADLLGLDYMANAGFDPRASVALWRSMSRIGGERPPDFLSTHPSSSARIAELEARMPAALRRMESSRSAGRRPDCPR
ncbi:MAG: M48 family metallopeptidase [Pseudomonadales bacterium]